jgi:hypothetical protein
MSILIFKFKEKNNIMKLILKNIHARVILEITLFIY